MSGDTQQVHGKGEEVVYGIKLISSFAFEDPQPFWLLAKLAVPAFSLIHPQGNTGKELTGHSSSQRHSAP